MAKVYLDATKFLAGTRTLTCEEFGSLSMLMLTVIDLTPSREIPVNLNDENIANLLAMPLHRWMKIKPHIFECLDFNASTGALSFEKFLCGPHGGIRR